MTEKLTREEIERLREVNSDPRRGEDWPLSASRRELLALCDMALASLASQEREQYARDKLTAEARVAELTRVVERIAGPFYSYVEIDSPGAQTGGQIIAEMQSIARQALTAAQGEDTNG